MSEAPPDPLLARCSALYADAMAATSRDIVVQLAEIVRTVAAEMVGKKDAEIAQLRRDVKFGFEAARICYADTLGLPHCDVNYCCCHRRATP